MRPTRSVAGWCGVAALIVSCKSEPAQPPPPVPTSVALSATTLGFDALDATATLTATVRDQNAQPIPGLAVTWASADAGVVSVNATSGLVTAVGNGQTTVRATHASLTADVAVEVGQVATQLAKVAGDGQSGEVGAALPLGIEVEARDRLGNPVPGGAAGFVVNSVVNFSVAPGGGSVADATVNLGPDGRASTTWTLGTVAGAHQASASLIGGSVSTSFAATALAGAADTLALVSGDGQPGGVGAPLADSLVVRVADAFGNPVVGHMVTFSTAGGGSLSPGTVASGADGRAASEWTLGPTPGQQNAEAAAAAAITGSPVTFTATASNAVATSVAVFEGDAQTGLVAFAVNIPPAVIVLDQNDNPFPGAVVTFAVETGGGMVTGAAALTDGNGIARVGSWTLGASPATNTLSATVTGAGIAGNPVTFTATGATAAFNITLRYLSTPTAAQQEAFDSAAAKWERLIYGDKTNIPLVMDSLACDTAAATPPINETVDDLLILVRLENIDGPSGTLGRAGPCFAIRSADSSAIVGVMWLDTADLADLEAAGQLDEVILHEMGHVLGYGSLWFLFDFLADTTTADPIYTGPFATRIFDEIGGTSYTGGNKVPVENTGGSGTRLAHWRESVFDEELMTGFLDGGIANPLSRLSTAAMQDLNYLVNLAGSDSYSQTFSLLLGPVTETPLREEVLPASLYTVDRNGRVVRRIWPR